MLLTGTGLLAQSDVGGDYIGIGAEGIGEIFGVEDGAELEEMILAGVEGMMNDLDGIMVGLSTSSNKAVAGPSPLSMTILASLGGSLFGDWKTTAILLVVAAFGAVESLPIVVELPTMTTERTVATSASGTTGERERKKGKGRRNGEGEEGGEFKI